MNLTGDLIGAIAAMVAARPELTVDETAERAERAARLMARNGYRAVRTHADVTADKSFTDDLDIDSLSMVEIAVQAEDKFGVKIPDDELAKLKTVGDAVTYIEANKA